MKSIYCVCGDRVETEGDAFAAMRRHSDEAHADLGIKDEQIRGLVTRAETMNEWDGERLVLPENVEIHALTPERKDDFLNYFDCEAFIDNPAWASCYCYFYRFPGTQEEWQKATAEENRAAQSAEIESGRASGFLAYADGEVVGWCHAAPRGDLPLLNAGPTEEDDGKKVASVVCFNVSPRYRQQGLSKALLETACATFAAEGFDAMEAYPARDFTSTSRAYHGALPMFLAEGFVEVGESEGRPVVRKQFTVDE